MYSTWRILAGAALLAVAACRPAAPSFADDLQSADTVARGAYLATAGDCAACHTAPRGKPFAGGLGVETPFGTLVSANITPDRQAGIGAWSDDEFVRAMTTGIAKGGVHLYPAMPYTAFTRVRRDDLLALRAYLTTIAPVAEAVETNRLPFPFDMRLSMIGWNMINFTPGEFRPDPAKSAEWNRGAYLADGLGHCGTCHTAKTFLGGDKSGPAMSGGALQGWFAPPLNSDARNGLGAWSVADIVAYLKTGWGGGQVAAGPMALVVEKSTSHLSDADLRAIAVYLKDIPGQPGTAVALDPGNPLMQTGRALYVANCAACHTESGAGISGIFPALAKSPVVQAAGTGTLLDVVLNGGHAVATDAAPTAPGMPGFGWQLPDDQIAALLTYIRNDWGNAASAVDANDVKVARTRPSE